MTGDRPRFADLIADAYHAVRALDGVNGSKSTPAAVHDGRRVYSQLLSYRRSFDMTAAEAALVQTALDLIGARLRSAKVG
jgi:hypothetical protein